MMEVGSPEEGAIKEMIPLGKTLYMVKERAIYAIKLADQIDPERSNIRIPNTQQKIASEGSDSERVCRILLTGKEPFNKSYLPEYDCERALTLCMRLLQDILAMNEATDLLCRDEELAVNSMKQSHGSLVLCAIPDVLSRAKGFMQKAEHAAQTLYAMCAFFFAADLENKGRWFDGFAELISERYGSNDEFSSFVQETVRFLKFLRNTRQLCGA